jgi:hypothetical protein
VVPRVDRASSALGARRWGWTRARVVARSAAVPIPVWLTLLVAVSALIRFVLALAVPAPFIYQDELLYSELAKSFGATGHFALRDVPGLAGVGPVYPVLISPAYALFDNLPHAYAAAKAINSLLMSLAAVPAYLIARRLLSRALSFAAAALAVSIPGLMYSGTIMTENAFYPIFLVWFLAFVLMLERPTIPRQIALFVLLGLAYETRSQAVALVPALVTALGLTIVFDGVFARSRSRGRAMLERAASFWLSWLVLAAGVVFFVVVEIGIRGQTVSASLLKTYSPLGSVNYTAGGVARWFLYLVSEMDIVVGVLPFAAFLVIFALACHRGHTSPALRAFAFATLAASFWLFVEVGAFASSPYSQRLQERNVFYLMPLFLTALMVWAARGAGRTGAATSVAAMAAAALTGIVPVTAFLNSNAVTDSFGLLAVWRPQTHFTIPLEWVTPAIVLIAIGVAAFFLLLPPRLALLAPALVLLFFAFSNREVEGFIGQAGRDSRDAGSQTGRDWIDRAVGRHALVSTLFTNNRNYQVLWNNEFFNRSVSSVYNFIGPPDGLPQQTVAPDPKTGALVVVGGKSVSAQYVLADTSLLLRGRAVATDPGEGMALYRVDGPVRLVGRLSGIYADSWSGPQASYTGYGCHGGYLSMRLTGDPDLQPHPQTIVATSGKRELGRVVVRPRSFHHPFTIPLVGKSGTCDVTFTVTPTAVPAQVFPGRPDTRVLGIRFEDVTYRPR